MKRTFALFAAAVATSFAPGIAAADSAYHDDVYAERFFVRADHGEHFASHQSAQQPKANAHAPKAVGKTREQVRKEMIDMTAEEKQRYDELYSR